MPIVIINSLPPKDSRRIPPMLERIRETGAEALKTTSDNIWVSFTPLQYQLNGLQAVEIERAEFQPLFVVVKLKSGRTQSEKTAFAQAITSEIAKGLAINSKKVWIQYQEMNPSEVWFEESWALK